jgi:hypothetical protein
MIMIYDYDDCPDAKRLRERQVGEARIARSQRPALAANTSATDRELDELVEQVRWEMRCEPNLERGRGRLAW